MAGRGKLPASYGDRNIPLRRPGEAAGGKSSISSQALLVLLNSLQFDGGDTRIIEKCTEVYKELVKKEGTVPIINVLHSTCLSNPKYSRRVAVWAGSLYYSSANHYRDVLQRVLAHLEENFENKEKFERKNEQMLLNLVELHGEIHRYLLVAEKPCKVLGRPLLDYLYLVLKSGSQAACQLILLQIVVNGEHLMNSLQLDFENFLVTLRRTLAKPDISSGSRTRLLLALEIAYKSFTFSDGPAKNFYSNELGDEFLLLQSRALGVPIKSSVSTKSDVSETLRSVSISSTNQNGIMSEVEAVRDRMRAKGLLPRNNTLDRDDDFYGIQIPKPGKNPSIQFIETKKTDLRNAKMTPLPGEDNWD